MKSFLEKSKRALVLLLTGAMIATSVPSTAFAATVNADAEDEIIFEDTQDVVENDAAALEEEVVAEDTSDSVDPDLSKDDVSYGVVAAAHTKFDVFLVSGENAVKWGTYTTVTTDPTNVSNTGTFDSVNGIDLYVVPKTGNEITDANLADAIKVVGAYKENSAAETEITIPETAYSIAKTSKPYVKSAGYDFTRAYVVTLKGDTEWLNAYKKAAHNGAPAADKAGFTKYLRVVVDDDKVTARKVKISVTGEDNAIDDPYVIYGADNTTPYDISPAFTTANWATKSVSVAFKKAGEEDVEFALAGSKTDTADGKNMTTANKDLAYFVDNSHNVYLSVTAINELFDDESKYAGYTLTITCADKAEDEAIHILAEEGSLVTFKGIGEKPTAANAQTATYNATITSAVATSSTGYEGLWYPFLAEVTGTVASTGRTITAIKYSVDGADAVVAKKLDDNTETAEGDIIYNAATGGTYTAQKTTTDGGYWVIPASDMVKGKTITLIAETTEHVTINLSQSEAKKSYVAYSGKVTIAVNADLTVTPTTTVDTGKDYEFTALAAENRYVSSVVAKMTQPGGGGGGTVPVVAGDAGKYTVENVTGKLSIFVETEPVSASNTNDVILTADLGSNGSVTDVATGDTITASVKGKAYSGKDFSFKVKPSDDKTISKVEYQMAGGDKIELSKNVSRSTIDGISYYTIPAVTGDISITVTQVDAARITKKANEDTTITITDPDLGAKELEDGKTALVKAGEAFSFTVATKNDATIEDVYYTSATGVSAVTSTSNAGEKLSATGATYKLGKDLIVSNSSKDIILTAVTSREADAGYTIDFTSADRPDATTDPANKIESLALKAGGKVATLSGDNESKVTVKAATKDKEGHNVTGTVKWALSDTSKAKEIVEFSAPTADTTNITSTKVSESNTITYKVIDGFPNGLRYEATLPVETTPMSTLYTDLDFELTAAAAGSITAISATDLKSSKMIRIDVPNGLSTPYVDDSMQYEINASLLGFNGEKTPPATIASADIASNKNITSVAWSVSPSYEPTLITKPYDLSASSGAATVVSAATKAQVLTVTATITYADESTAEISDTLTVVDEKYGYVAVPYVTQADVSAPGSTVLLETKANGVGSAQVSWRVFKINSSPTPNWYKTVSGIDTDLEAEIIEEVPAADITWADAIVTGNTDDAYATVTGKNQVSITAKKAPGTIKISPSATVNGVPVIKAADVTVYIHNELELFNVAVNTMDPYQLYLATEYTEGLAYPKMTAGLASLKPISWVATPASITSDNEIYEGFELTSVAEGTILTLPSQDAFDGTSIDKKRVLAGWDVRVDDNNSSNSGTPDGYIDNYDTANYYKADGTATVTISEDVLITAIWAYRYESAPGTADGQVALYKVVGDADPELVGSSITVAQGKEIETGIGFYAIDLTKAPTAAGAVYDDADATKLVYGEAAGGTLTLADDPERGTVTIEGNIIKGGTIGSGETIAVKWVDANGAEYSTYNSGALEVATDGLIAPTITATTETAAVYSVEVAEFEGLEVGQTKTIGITVKNTNTDTEITKRDGFKSVEWTVEPADAISVGWAVESASATDSLKSGFTITGLKPGTATLTFKAVDANGAEATLTQPLSVTVENGSTIDVKITNAVTGEDGETVAANAEMGVLVGAANNKISLALVEKDGTKPATNSANWSISASDAAGVVAGDDVDAWTTAALTVGSDKTSTLTTPAHLGLKKLTVTYTTDTTPATKTWYTRVIDVRSYYAVAVMGPVDDTEAANYEIKNGTTTIGTDEKAYIRVPYVDGSKDSADTFTADLTGFTAKYIGTGTSKLEHKGWSYQNGIIKTDGSNKDCDVNGSKSLTDTQWNAIDASGIISVYALFGIESAKLSGLPTEVVLSDETLSKTDKSVNGTDRQYVQIGVTPKDSASVITLTATDAGKVVLVKDADTYPKSGAAVDGYDLTKESAATSTVWAGTSAGNGTLGINPGGSASSRTDSFTIAKINDPTNRSRNYVGTMTLTVKVDGEEYATIPVFLNGEFKNDAGKIAYMERGQVLESGYRTVNGKIHYYKDSVIVEAGVVEVEGKKILIVDNAQVTTVGDAMYNGDHYYVGADGFLKTGKFTGEGTSDKSVTYYADEDGVLAVNQFVELDSALYFFSADAPTGHLLTGTGDKFVALTVTEEGNWKGTFDYVVGTDGKVLTANTIKVGEVTWYVNSYGQKVTYDDATEDRGTNADGKKYGKYTDPVTKAKWVILENGNAEMDDVLYAPVVTWTTAWPTKYTKKTALPEMKYTITYTSKNGNTVVPREGTAVVTSDPSPIADDATVASLIAVADLTGFYTDADMTAAATVENTPSASTTVKYIFKDGGAEGISDIWYAPTVEWTTQWPTKWSKSTAYPTMTYKVTYTSKESGTQVVSDEMTATITSVPATIASDSTEVTFTAAADLTSYYTDETGATLVDPATIANSSISRKYVFKDGGAEGVAGTYTYKSHTFTWGELATKDAVAPTVTAKVVYTLTLEDGTKSIEEVTTTPSVKEETNTAKDRRTFTATISTMDEKIASVFETKTYSIKGDTPATGGLEGLVVEGLEDEYYYTGSAIQPAFRLVDYDIEDGVVLGKGTDYKVSYKNPATKDIQNAKDATGSIVINGIGNYAGQNLTVPFKIVNALKSADDVTNVATSVKKIVASDKKFTFTGEPQAPATLTITTDAGDLTYTYDATTNEYTNTTAGDSPKDVIVTVSNNINAGKGFVAAVGTDGKIKKAPFTIAKFNLKKATADQLAVVVNGGDDVPFSAFAKGAQPLVEATFTATTTSTPVDMVAGNDFTVNYQNNKASGSGSVTLKGKNNFSGVTTTATSFNIEKFDLSQVNEDDVVVNAYATLAAKKVAVTFTDSYGNIVPAKTYTVSVTGAANTKLAAGEKITITVTAKDASYENGFEISDFEVLNGINKAKLVVDKDYAKANIVYTGSPIILTEMLDSGNNNPFESGKIVVKIKNQILKYGEDYEVVSYANNIKKGKMTVNLKGIGSYTGYAKGTVTIAAKPITKINAE